MKSVVWCPDGVGSGSETDRHVGQKIVIAREQQGIDRHELAAYLSVTTEIMEEYETGRRRVPSHILHKIADMVHVDMEFFFEDL